ncbi:MAG: ADP-ribosylation factor-like protein [Planctomycetota bacterium]
MVQINFAQNEIHFKVVYYGPGFSGKTTNIESIFHLIHPGKKTQLTTIATEGDRTLYFDFAPLNLGKISGLTTKLQLYTVPGQVFYKATRQIVLQGADGIVFIADSRKDRMDANLESFNDLKDNLSKEKLNLENIPLVMQWNKRDLDNVMSVEEMEEKLNTGHWKSFSAVAPKAIGVGETLREITRQVLATMQE